MNEHVSVPREIAGERKVIGSRHQRSIIYLDNVTVDFDGFKALNQLNLIVDYHELRVVIGPNGAGKSTLLDVISGKVQPVAGRAVFGQATDLIGLRGKSNRCVGHRPKIPNALGLYHPPRVGQPRPFTP